MDGLSTGHSPPGRKREKKRSCRLRNSQSDNRQPLCTAARDDELRAPVQTIQIMILIVNKEQWTLQTTSETASLLLLPLPPAQRCEGVTYRLRSRSFGNDKYSAYA